MMKRILTAVFLMLPLPAMAEEVVLGLSKNQVAITTSFDGSDILVFGAVKRETPINSEEPLEVIISIEGPSEPIVVRRKENRFGIWVNTDSLEVDRAPSFYAIATTAPFHEVLSDVEDLRHHVSIDRAIRSVGAPQNISDAEAFTDAVIRIREGKGLYQLLEGQVALDQQTLFRTRIDMPADLTEGNYITRILLTRNGVVVSKYEAVVDVRKVGLERFLFNMSREQPFWYGIMSLIIAIAAGWGASAAFSMLRNN